MTKKDIVIQLKKMVGLFADEEAAAPKVYGENEIKISAFEVGGKVELISSNGELSQAPDGDYELTDGSKFSVKDGVIASIEGQEQPSTEDVEVVAEEAPAEEAPADDSKAKIDELEAKISALEKELADIKSQFQADEKVVEEFMKHIADLNKNVELLANTPVQFSQVNKSQKEKESREEKLSAFAKILGGIK